MALTFDARAYLNLAATFLRDAEHDETLEAKRASLEMAKNEAEEAVRQIRGLIEDCSPKVEVQEVNPLKRMAARMAEEADSLARAAGMPESFIDLMKAHRERPRAAELVRSLIYVQPMPDGAKPIYDKDPGVAGLVTKDPGEEG